MHDFKHYPKTAEAPNVLRVRADGTIFCVDGTSAQARLRELFAQVARSGETEMPVCILHREGYASLASDAFLARNMAA